MADTNCEIMDRDIKENAGNAHKGKWIKNLETLKTRNEILNKFCIIILKR